ncbi:MAG: type II/IV secretion system protein [Alphaproteobacteria bacterium]|nr:type II/IV secretion system protein [Alphaproteobacteria bacterium]
MTEALADYLLKAGRLDATALARAQAVSERRGERLHLVLAGLGLVSEAELARALATTLGLACLTPEELPERPVLGDRVALEFLRKTRVLPLREDPRGLRLAMADPFDDYAAEAIALLTGRPVERVVAPAGELERAIERLHGGQPKLAVVGPAAAVDDADLRRLSEQASDAPTIRLVQRLLAEAVEAAASDLHVEPFEDRVRVRLRIDGLLVERHVLPRQVEAAVVSRIKVIAGLDIAERRLPQDGRTRVAVSGREIDVRVSVVPTLHGESVVLRLLDRERAPLTLPQLGFEAGLVDGLDRLLANPHGLVLVTGPTGSGKTTTLYAALQRLDRDRLKVLTVEDPVEYQLAGVNQIQVKPQIGLDFANVLRAVLRQDPDIILVGEIRDPATARIAVQAALTGHLVLATLHTNSAVAAVTRLADMGVENYLLASVLHGVLAQRLLRRLCATCAGPRSPPLPAPAAVGPAATRPVHPAAGCSACAGTGYRGRFAVGELLTLSPDLAQQIARGTDEAGLARLARADGMIDLRAAALAKVTEGATSLEEVARVIDRA